MDDILQRQMPHSVQAEQAVIGSMLIDSGCIAEVVGLLTADSFYVKANRDIYEIIYSMFSFSKVIDPVTVLEQMRISGKANEGTASYLAELMEITPTAANVKKYAQIVADKALLRSIAATGEEVSAMAYEGEGEARDILEAAEKQIYSLRSERETNGLVPISEVLVGVYDRLTDISVNGAQMPGLSTGLPDLDNVILGLNKSDLILFASRPGMGKTSIALNIASHVAKTSGKTVAMFSLEMSREQLCLRLLSGESFVDNKKLQTGKLSSAEWDKVAAAAAAISGYDLRINDNPSLTVANMNAQCRRLDNLGLVVIDYLQLMQSSGSSTKYSGENRQQVVSDISRMLKIMAKELNVPVLCLSQLSRANEKDGSKPRRPRLSDLRESGSIEQDADIVIALHREDYYDSETENVNLAECIVLKNRHGETRTIELQWLPEYTTYSSVEKRYTEN